MKKFFSWLHKWWDISRAPFLVLLLLPVILAGMIAYKHGSFAWTTFLLVALGVSLLGLGANMINDYFDFRSGVDLKKIEYLSTKGLNKTVYRQSNPISDGRVKAETVRNAAWVCFALSVPIGILIQPRSGYPLVIFGILGFLIAYFYSAPPLDLSSHGLGEIFPGIAYGPLLMAGTYYALSGHLAIEPLLASIPVGLLVSLVRWVDAIPGYLAHRAVGETKLTVRLGPQKAGRVIPFLQAFAFASILGGIVSGIMPLGLLVTLLALPLAVRANRLAHHSAGDPVRFIPVAQAVMGGSVATLLLMIVGYGLDRVL